MGVGVGSRSREEEEDLLEKTHTNQMQCLDLARVVFLTHHL